MILEFLTNECRVGVCAQSARWLLRAEQASTDASALVDITAVLQPPPSLRDTGREVGGRDLAVGNTSQANAT